MAEQCVLGIDVGTTGTKCLMVSDQRGIIASAYQGYPLQTPAVGQCEQRAEDWWDAVVATVRSVCQQTGAADSVRAISMSTQGGTVVPVDEHFNPLCAAIVWNDKRCTAEAEDFAAKYGRKYFYNTCGWNLSRGLPALELRQMREKRPEIFRAASKFLTVPDFVAAKLTGRAAVDMSNAGINQLTDVRRHCHDEKILDYVGITADKLPELVDSGDVIGTLTKEAAAELGLREDTVLVAGAHDQYAVALGSGITEPGDAVIGTGTAWVVVALSEQPDFESGMPLSLSASKGMWGSMVSISTGGGCLDWFRKNIAGLEGDALDYDTINREIAKTMGSDNGGLMFYPYFSGSSAPESDTCSKGTLIGLDLSHTRCDIARAVMEGVACQIVWAMEKLEQSHPIHRLRMAGGATKSPVWTRMVAEIAGKPVTISDVPDLACAGAAILAQAGCGIVADVTEGARKLSVHERVIEPTEEGKNYYRKVFEQYKKNAAMLRQMYAEGGK